MASESLVNEKDVCTSSVKKSDSIMIKLHYKNYCSILKRVIKEAKMYILNV